MKIFRKPNLIIFTQEEILASPKTTALKLYNFLGVSSDNIHPSIFEIELSAMDPRLPIINKTVKFSAMSLRKANLHSILAIGKKSKMIRRVLYKPAEYDKNEIRKWLTSELNDETSKTELALGRKLPEWRTAR